MIWEIVRFNALATHAITSKALDNELSLGDWLKERDFSDMFIENYILVCWSNWTCRGKSLDLTVLSTRHKANHSIDLYVFYPILPP